MAVNKALVLALDFGSNVSINFSFVFLDTVNTTVVEQGLLSLVLGTDITTCTLSDIQAGISNQILAYATTQGYSITSNDIVWGENLLSADEVSKLKNMTTKSFATVSHSLNSAFQISSTREAEVSYSVDIACTISLTSGQTGTVYLEYADDSGFTTNVKEVQRFVNGNSGTLTLGLNLTQTNTASLTGLIPAGKYVRLRTQNNTGTPTFTYRSGFEVLI